MESAISLHKVGVEFPLYDISHRSAKQRLLSIAKGRFSLTTDAVLSVRALRNVTLKVSRGERVALIGLNGAGKTTLLQIMAGIYKPCSGACVTRGRIASMLNIMLGMSGENTGHENIVLRGTFLGWKEDELKAKVKEIAAFSDLGAFLDVPIRTYSTGMRLRLAFSISTAIAPDILLMDEWIGFGDQSFAGRAEDRMMQLVARAGILVIASHSAALLERVCFRGIVMHQGEIVYDGPIHAALQYYDTEIARDPTAVLNSA
jgi:ABC-type polysaccharide/polyol phosphate transport system ATPase subunit